MYLVEETSNGALFALKKIRCPFGQESVSLAMKEVEAYSLFTPHPNIIRCIDHCIVADRSDPGAKTVYILLPYYRRGNLQDVINANLVNSTKFPERDLMQLFLGVCKALSAMHNYKVEGGPGGKSSARKARRNREEAAHADDEAADEMRAPKRKGTGMDADAEEEQAEPLMEGEVTRSQEGIAPGGARAYAHRDIKPGLTPHVELSTEFCAKYK